MTLLNMLEKPCPIPVIETKKILKTLKPGESVSILVDNDIARQNLEKMALNLGHQFEYKTDENKNILITLTLGTQASVLVKENDTFVLSIGSNIMGTGSEELGLTLMKSYIYALTELETPPESILFFNSGVLLTTEGATTLDDLHILAAKGVNISSCGACLNYYGLTEKLKVGDATNMLAIATITSQAKRLVNL